MHVLDVDSAIEYPIHFSRNDSPGYLLVAPRIFLLQRAACRLHAYLSKDTPTKRMTRVKIAGMIFNRPK